MEDFKYISSKTNIISISNSLNKVVKSVHQNKQNSASEIELLKNLCKSENLQISSLAAQTFIKLVEDGVLETSQVISTFIALLPNVGFSHLTSLSDGIIEVLLIDLKRRCGHKGVKYICQFDLKPPQHPFILLLSRDVNNMVYFANKVKEICQHHDKLIKSNSIEFLRPVFLYVFCNSSIFPESRSLWRSLVELSETDSRALDLFYDIISWSKTSNAQSCLYTNSLVSEAIEIYSNRPEITLDLSLYLISISRKYSSFNFDPTTNFKIILSVLYSSPDASQYYGLLSFICADLMQEISPKYLSDLMRIIRFLLEKDACNKMVQYMLLDGAIQWMAHPTFISNYLEDMEFIVHYVLKNKKGSASTKRLKSKILHFNPDLAKSYDLCLIFDTEHNIEKILANVEKNLDFCDKISHILRSLFLNQELTFDLWEKVFSLLMKLAKNNEDLSFKMLMLILYKLANETHPKTRLSLLQNLASLGAKDQVLSTLRVLSKDIEKTFCFDLYLRLWKAEPRTYPFLYNILKESVAKSRDGQWEFDIAKTYTIKEICLIKPQQHGADLLNLFSDILNRPAESDSDIAVSLAINAIAILCENHVVNIVSTWKVLGFKFTYEKRPRVVKSLCRFFSQIPYIKSSTLENDKLVCDIVAKLWSYVTDFDDKEIIIPALIALRHFPPETMTLGQIPAIFRQNIEISEEEPDQPVPGECWIQLIQYVNFSAIEEAGDLVAHHIHNEIESFRGGVYLLPEGRPEPSSLKYLPKKSILSALVSHLIVQSQQSKINTSNEIVLINILRVLSKEYPKPIPPLDWCFLHEYFHLCFEMKKYCILIAAKQIQQSGTARRLIENFMNEIMDDEIMEDDAIALFEVLKYLSNGVRNDVFRRYIFKAMQFAFEESFEGGFTEECIFSKLLTLIKPAIDENCLIEQNLTVICETVDSFYHRIPEANDIFSKIVETVSLLPEKYLNQLVKPNLWNEVTEHQLRKAIKVQCELYKNNKMLQNPLIGLNEIIEGVSKFDDDGNRIKTYFLASLETLMLNYDHEKCISDWLMGAIGKIQALLTNKEVQEGVFLIKIFMTIINVLSGWKFITLGDCNDDDERLSKFPCSLSMLIQKSPWKETENRIYEFLYYLFNNPDVPGPYTECFKNAIICCKNQPYFASSKVWLKFVALR